MTNEMMKKAKECKSAEELLYLAKENGIDLTEEEAAAKFAEFRSEGELSDDELDSASGGGCGDPDPKKGETWIIKKKYSEHYCPNCNCNTVIYDGESYNQLSNLPNMVNLTCTQCGTSYCFYHNWTTEEFMIKA